MCGAWHGEARRGLSSKQQQPGLKDETLPGSGNAASLSRALDEPLASLTFYNEGEKKRAQEEGTFFFVPVFLLTSRGSRRRFLRM